MVDKSSKKRVHGMSMMLEVLCNQHGGNLTSMIVRRPYSRIRLGKLVTCRKCKRIMANG